MRNIRRNIDALRSEDVMYRKKWPIFEKKKLPKVIKIMIWKYGVDHNVRSMRYIQFILGHSRLYRYILQNPLVYALIPVQRLYRQILIELREAGYEKA